VRPLEAPPRWPTAAASTDTTSTMPRPHVELPDHGVAVPRPDLCNPDEFSVGLRHEQDAIRQSGQQTLARPPQVDLLLCSSRSDDRVVVGRYDHRTERSDGVEILLVCQPDHDLGFHRHPPPFSWSTTQPSHDRRSRSLSPAPWAQPTHLRVMGRARSRSAGISPPQTTQRSWIPDRTLSTARSMSTNSCSAADASETTCARSKAIVEPSGSCSSSREASDERSTISSKSPRRASRRLSVRCRRSSRSASRSCVRLGSTNPWCRVDERRARPLPRDLGPTESETQQRLRPSCCTSVSPCKRLGR
jgi:hypothetical protein